jgi:anti-sigma B factor antagonist
MQAHGSAPSPIALGHQAGHGSPIEGAPLLMGVELSLHGELDASNARDLEDEVRRWVQVGGARRTVIDLRGLADIDSTGLAVLLRIAHRARELGHSLGLRRPAGQVGRMIALAGLDEALPFID